MHFYKIPVSEKSFETKDSVSLHFKVIELPEAFTNYHGEMTSGIAHEINNPLTIILGRITLLKKRIEKNEKPEVLNNEVNLIEKTVYRISNIVNGLRRLSRDNTKDPIEEFSIKKLIDESNNYLLKN